MTDESIKMILDKLDLVISKAGTATTNFLPVIKHKLITESWLTIGVCSFVELVIMVFIIIAVKEAKKDSEWCIALFLAAILGILVFIGIVCEIHTLLNLDYYAIESLLHMAK